MNQSLPGAIRPAPGRSSHCRITDQPHSFTSGSMRRAFGAAHAYAGQAKLAIRAAHFIFPVLEIEVA
ncbi:hypothetical protein BN2475_1070017 [Paraburkholderia ribeironis]|uniref:Uncharacterized protein n=1 Tax=Paraburkholderia ribeironis TaxID=1247936 RepID=A0A1N7SML4_9BURK|nr:hypothetical protein BN2475_1070017 [Paraburkholderia ribeironis]